jgi:hypothetical protein
MAVCAAVVEILVSMLHHPDGAAAPHVITAPLQTPSPCCQGGCFPAASMDVCTLQLAFILSLLRKRGPNVWEA